MNHSSSRLANSYLEVNLRLLRDNVRSILDSLGDGVRLIPVLKDDAYGLGMIPVAKAIDSFSEIDTLAVAHVSEGLCLREAGISREILVMGAALPFQLETAVDAELTLTCARPGFAEELADAARKQHKQARLQIKIDTGLHRIGLEHSELGRFAEAYRSHRDTLRVMGVYSHFSDACDLRQDAAQYGRFLAATDALLQQKVPLPVRHISCSASSELYPQFELDAVRCGRRLFMDRTKNPLGNIREVASYRSYITTIRPRRKGDRLGYCGSCVLTEDCTVATVGIGYGDGIHQDLFRVHAPVLVRGGYGHLLACCMDQCMIDVTGLNCSVGDEVTFFGYDGNGGFLSSQAQAALINDDEGCGLTSALSPRVARIYRGAERL